MLIVQCIPDNMSSTAVGHCIVVYINRFWRVLPHHVRHMISLMPGLLTMCSLSGQTQHLRDEDAGERTTDWQLSRKNRTFETSLLPLQSWPAPHDF